MNAVRRKLPFPNVNDKGSTGIKRRAEAARVTGDDERANSNDNPLGGLHRMLNR